MATAANQSLQDYSKRTRIVAAYLYVNRHRSLGFQRKKTAEAIGVSYEYLRQVVADLESDQREMVADYELEAAQDKMLQAEVGRRLRDAGAIDTEAPDTIEVNIDDLRRELERLRTLEESASRGDEEREWVAASARAFLENLVEDAS